MYLLDTNVISELRRRDRADAGVIAWSKTVSPTWMHISVISILEIEMGILMLQRKDSAQATILREWFSKKVMYAFKNRIIPIDATVAKQCAILHVPDKKQDRDAMIQATAMVHGMTLVTRNVNDFDTTRTQIINPWEACDANAVV